MSYLLRTSRTPAKLVIARSAASVRSFTTSTTLKLKESDRHTDNLGEQNEKHKQDQLQKQKKGEGHWKPELASDSEEAVAADRHEHSDHSQDGIKELQRKTKDHAEEKHKTGTSQDTGL